MRSCWVDVIVVRCVRGRAGDMSIVFCVAWCVVALFRCASVLSGSLFRVGVAVGLKKLVIDGVFLVLGMVCCVLDAWWMLGCLPTVGVVVGVLVVMFLGRWGDVMVDVTPTGEAT